MNKSDTSDNTGTGNVHFIKEVAKYFMDFLETDFHKRRLPRRSIKFRNNDNLLIGLNLQKYPDFYKKILSLISKGFDDNKTSTRIKRGSYRTNLPQNLLSLIKLQIEHINEAQMDILAGQIAEKIESLGSLYSKEYDNATISSIQESETIIRTGLVIPFVEQIEKPLQNLNLGDENNLRVVEDELTNILLAMLEDHIPTMLKFYIADEDVDIKNEVLSLFNVTDIKANLESFFDNLQFADLFLELFEMEKNKLIFDKQEFYLYFGDIQFGNTKYPIFYIPFNLARNGDGFEMEFDSQIYINKKAMGYIAQEYNNVTGTTGNLNTISERIIYLAKKGLDIPKELYRVFDECSDFFSLDTKIDFSGNQLRTARGTQVRISNNCYISLFDNADEALVNDYEEILEKLEIDNGPLTTIFDSIIEDFIHHNPLSFNLEVEDEWDRSETSERLVHASPVPLNSEQRQILGALNKEGCKYLVVEGPPGTGKSHTITAIVFDAILKGKSVIVLSDKKEALDVVEDKITDTMNKIRLGDSFQNPILRLGKTGSTYNSILSSASINSIKDHHRAYRREKGDLEKYILQSQELLKAEIKKEVIAYEGINLQEIKEHSELESYFDNNGFDIDVTELSASSESLEDIKQLRHYLSRFKNVISSAHSVVLINQIVGNWDNLRSIDDLQKVLDILRTATSSVDQIKKQFNYWPSIVNKFHRITTREFLGIGRFIQDYSNLSHSIFGYLFKGSDIKNLEGQFKNDFVDSPFPVPHQAIEEMQKTHQLYSIIHESGKKIESRIPNSSHDDVAIVHNLLKDEDMLEASGELIALGKDIDIIERIQNSYPKTAKTLGLYTALSVPLILNLSEKLNSTSMDNQIRYIHLSQLLPRSFEQIPQLDYASEMRNIEDLVTSQVTSVLDESVINFSEHNRNDVQTLRGIIRNKQQFPRELFNQVKKAFPCILAGIRDYAEYIPLEAELFDLVIIDEASQVSIAQAFPALIRGKKVLVLGDKKQFSNVKSAQARSDTNRQYLNQLEASFRENISTDILKSERLKKFNIKTSILDFFGSITNYRIQLMKYFRGYKEIISYSNKAFYQDSLQVMKIRGKPIDEVIKFSNIDASSRDKLYQNTNNKEVEFIIEQLKKLKDENSTASVGIITPHTNQQKLLVAMISKTEEWDYYLHTLRLKIMTFDTCQGEERDIVFYSMVASLEDDKLWGIFIKDLKTIDPEEEEGLIKAQRLNVGFSRAKECMHFVLSKPIEDYSGSIGEALRHYHNTINAAKEERQSQEVDPKSKMEPVLMNWFYQTPFWQDNKERIEFIPQFKMGEYLQILDRHYTHPQYVVDFLLLYTDELGGNHKVIIEYDGFTEHFKETNYINEYNYQDYYKEDDVYRQKILEGYGYQFLRVNKFNSGTNPILTLDQRMQQIVKKKHRELTHSYPLSTMQ